MSKRKRLNINEALAETGSIDWLDLLQEGADAALVVRLLPRMLNDMMKEGALEEGLEAVKGCLVGTGNKYYPLLAGAVALLTQACCGEASGDVPDIVCTEMWEVMFHEPHKVPGIVQGQILTSNWLTNVDMSSQDIVEINLAAIVTVALHAKEDTKLAIAKTLWAMQGTLALLPECLARLVLNLGTGKWLQDVTSVPNTGSMNKAMDVLQTVSPAVYWKTLQLWIGGQPDVAILRCLKYPPEGFQQAACDLLIDKNLSQLARVISREGNQTWPLLRHASKGFGVETKVLAIIHDVIEDKDIPMERYRATVDEALKEGSSRGCVLCVVGTAMFPEGSEGDAERVLQAIKDPNAALVCTLLTLKAHEAGPRSMHDAGALILALCGMDTSQLNWNSPEILLGTGGRSILTSLLPQADIVEQLVSIDLAGLDTAPLKGVDIFISVMHSLVKLMQYTYSALTDMGVLLTWLDGQLLSAAATGPLTDDTFAAMTFVVGKHLPQCVWEGRQIRDRIEGCLGGPAGLTKGMVLVLLAFQVVQGDKEKGAIYSELLNCPLKELLEKGKGDHFHQQLQSAMRHVVPHVLLKPYTTDKPEVSLSEAIHAALGGDTRGWLCYTAVHPEKAYIGLLGAMWDAAVVEPFLLCPRSDGEVVTSVYLPEMLMRVKASVLRDAAQVDLYLEIVEYYVTAVEGYGKVQQSDAFAKVQAQQCAVLALRLMNRFEGVIRERPQVLQRVGATLRLLTRRDQVVGTLLTEGFPTVFIPCFTHHIMHHALACLSASSLSIQEQATSFCVLLSGVFPLPNHAPLSHTLLSLLCTILPQTTPTLTTLLLEHASQIQAILASDCVPPEQCLSLVRCLPRVDEGKQLRKMLIDIAVGLKEYS